MNTHLFTILILLVFLISCKDNSGVGTDSSTGEKDKKEMLSFSIETLSKQSKNCALDSTTCASIDIAVPHARGTAAADPINARITGALVEAIDMGDVHSTGLDDAAGRFVASYDSFLVEMKADGQAFISSWAFETEGQVLYRDSQYICVELPFYTYTGGAHPNTFTKILNFDAQSGEEINVLDLIPDTVAFKRLAEEGFRTAREFDSDTDLQAEGFFWGKAFFLPANMGIVENGFYLVYDPYEAAPYAAGSTTFVVPR
ncbi:MAG: DUF4163 domain-containing protein [Bacteroidia bacterium]